MLLIVLKRPCGTVDHITHGTDDADTCMLFKMLKETRSALKIPIAELHDIEFGEPIETHTKAK